MIETKEGCLFLSWDATEVIDVDEMKDILKATVNQMIQIHSDLHYVSCEVMEIDAGGQEYILALYTPGRSKEKILKIWQTIE